jgi:hypothetical protein
MLKHSSRVGAVVVRSFGLGVLALAVLVGLTVSAQQQPAQPVTQIEIVPESSRLSTTRSQSSCRGPSPMRAPRIPPRPKSKRTK